jgi:hypothetical protein
LRFKERRCEGVFKLLRQDLRQFKKKCKCTFMLNSPINAKPCYKGIKEPNCCILEWSTGNFVNSIMRWDSTN